MQDNVLIPPQVYAVPPGAGLTRVFIREMVAANCKLPLLVAGWYTSEGGNFLWGGEERETYNFIF